jgi:hypothetical protein
MESPVVIPWALWEGSIWLRVGMLRNNATRTTTRRFEARSLRVIFYVYGLFGRFLYITVLWNDMHKTLNSDHFGATVTVIPRALFCPPNPVYLLSISRNTRKETTTHAICPTLD